MRFPWFLNSPLFAEDDGASGTTAIAPGDPFEHDHADPDDDSEEPVESASDKELKAIKAELADTKRKLSETEQDARHWATQARRPAPAAAATPAAVEEEETGDDLDGDPNKFLDDLSSKGAKVLKEKGFITKSDLKEVIQELRADTDNKISGTVKATRLDALMAEEFPELVADSIEVDKAKKTGARAEVSDLFRRTTEIYNQSIEADANLSGSPAIMLLAARQARAEMKAEGKGKPADSEVVPVETRPQSRRSRIEAGRPARDTQRDEDRGGGRSELTAQQREVAQRLNVPESDYKTQQQKIERTRRRG